MFDGMVDMSLERSTQGREGIWVCGQVALENSTVLIYGRYQIAKSRTNRPRQLRPALRADLRVSAETLAMKERHVRLLFIGLTIATCGVGSVLLSREAAPEPDEAARAEAFFGLADIRTRVAENDALRDISNGEVRVWFVGCPVWIDSYRAERNYIYEKYGLKQDSIAFGSTAAINDYVSRYNSVIWEHIRTTYDKTEREIREEAKANQQPQTTPASAPR